jgi:8-oxo-dGTP pyrophosphatase MutT (NUDIX family)
MAQSPGPQVKIVLRSLIQNEKAEILLMQRAMGDNYLPGWWELPGGKLEDGQSTSEARAREALEESGFDIEPISPLIHEGSLVHDDGKYAGVTYIVLTGLARVTGGQLKLSHEHDDSRWVPRDVALAEFELTDEARSAIIGLGSLMIQGASAH